MCVCVRRLQYTGDGMVCSVHTHTHTHTHHTHTNTHTHTHTRIRYIRYTEAGSLGYITWYATDAVCVSIYTYICV